MSIQIRDVHKSFGPLEVIKGVSMTVEKGEVVSIIGGSGSGKSTLLMCINGLEPINSGKIVVDGADVHARSTNLNKRGARSAWCSSNGMRFRT
jgi:hydroxyproline transport system ATP-binding protein